MEDMLMQLQAWEYYAKIYVTLCNMCTRFSF